MKILETKREKILFISITALGISSIITQIILFREFMNIFYGNELVFGIILGNWLALTGIGAYIGRISIKIKKKLRVLYTMQILISLLPLFLVPGVRALRLLYTYGITLNIFYVLFFTFLILLPYCLISGFLLTFTCSVFSLKRNKTQIAKVYLIDNIGDILGGFLFSFIFVYFFNPIQITVILFTINIFASILISKLIKSRKLLIICFLLLLLLIPLTFFDINTQTISFLFKGQKILNNEYTPYGNIVVTKLGNQLNFYESGILLFSTENYIESEETIHYAMSQTNAKDVLLISGGISGTLEELKKYGVKVDYVELDPKLIEIGKNYGLIKNATLYLTDGRLFIKKTKQKYDVIIIDLPDPSNQQINRFYTLEFFNEVKKKLRDGGTLSLSVCSSENYLNVETSKLNAAIYKTLKKVFRNVLVIPGDENYFVASDFNLTYNISKNLKNKGIKTKYVNENYLKAKLSTERINYIKNLLEKENVKINHDFFPVMPLYHLKYWLSYFKFNLVPLFILLFFSIIYLLYKATPLTFSISTTGFAASGLEVAIIVAFQIVYGYVYSKVGIIIASFMLGLAIGSYIANIYFYKLKKKHLVFFEFLIFFYSLMLPYFFIFSKKFNFPEIFSFLALLLAIFVGFEFPIASKVKYGNEKIEEIASSLYSADLFGAFYGSLLVSSILIPLIGVFKVCYLIALLNLISGCILAFKD